MQDKRKINIDDLEKKQVFSVPDGYFDQLPRLISHKVAQSQSTLSWFMLPVFRYGMAIASVLLVIFLSYFLTRTPVTVPEPPEAILSQVSGQDIIQYLQQAELSQYELVESASEANIVIEENALEEIDINRDIILEEADTDLIEEFI